MYQIVKFDPRRKEFIRENITLTLFMARMLLRLYSYCGIYAEIWKL